MADEKTPDAQATADADGKADDKPVEKPGEQKPAEKKADEKPAEKPAEKKADAPAGADGKATKDAKAEPAGKDADPAKAPEQYSLAIPKDAEAYLDAADLTTFETTARAKGLSNEQAQAWLEEHADALATQSAAFRAETEADPTYGGDKLPETQRLALLALDRIRPAGTPAGDEIRRLLAKTGYGNHKAVVSLLADLGKQMDEDSPAHGSPGSGPPKPIAERMYPAQAAG